MFSRLILIALCFPVLSVNASEDEWLGDDKGYFLNFKYGVDNEDSGLLGLDAIVPFASASQLDFSYISMTSESSIGDFEFDQKRIGWQSNPFAKWSFGFAYSTSGESREIEIDEIEASIFFNGPSWSLGSRYLMADIQGFSEGETELVKGEKTGIRLQANYDGANWGGGFSFQDNDYDYETLAPLRVLAREDIDQNFLISRNALRQIFSLTNWESDLSAYYMTDKWMFTAGISNYELRRERAQGTEYYLNADYSMSSHWMLSLLGNIDDEGTVYSELSVGVSW